MQFDSYKTCTRPIISSVSCSGQSSSFNLPQKNRPRPRGTQRTSLGRSPRLAVEELGRRCRGPGVRCSPAMSPLFRADMSRSGSSRTTARRIRSTCGRSASSSRSSSSLCQRHRSSRGKLEGLQLVPTEGGLHLLPKEPLLLSEEAVQDRLLDLPRVRLRAVQEAVDGHPPPREEDDEPPLAGLIRVPTSYGLEEQLRRLPLDHVPVLLRPAGHGGTTPSCS
jgi:hypothetical protein